MYYKFSMMINYFFLLCHVVILKLILEIIIQVNVFVNKDTWDQDVIDLVKKDFMVLVADKLVLDTLEVSYNT